jgi:hypothetical protein
MLSADKSCSNFSNKPQTEFYIENNRHITLLKVVNNLMMLYIGMALWFGYFIRNYINNCFYFFFWNYKIHFCMFLIIILLNYNEY